ncbi:MAG TPA: WYL domain-containing protein [Acidimicrobiia bacterium]|nr:WYL domain-containing protein [Acidimicrobiia bacterium]
MIERILNLLIFLLETPRPVTATEIRSTVAGYGDQGDEAFHRMFERDKELLRRLGVPLERKALDAWEVDYGYTVDPEQYALPDPGLTEEERVALSVAARIVRLGGSHTGLDALLKLGGIERGAGLEPLGADLGAEPGILGTLFEAVTARQEVEFDYRNQRRTARPYGLAHRRGHWYLVAGTERGDRIYRVDRVEGVSLVGKPKAFDKPKDFNIRSVMRDQPWESGEDPTVEATVRFDPDVAWWAARTLGVAEPMGDLVATVPVANRDAFIGWVLSFGDGAEVVAPVDLRAEVVRRVEAALEALP